MGALEELGIDTIAGVQLPVNGWHAAALKMIEDRRRQVTRAQARASTERQEEAVLSELKRLADLETFVRACQNLPLTPVLALDRERGVNGNASHEAPAGKSAEISDEDFPF